MKSIIYWLYTCCALVFAMAVIGAVTRLTESGLSMTEWQPVAGVLPPLNAAQWQHQFDLYRASPEFRAKHFWMGLDDFKRIFFWEWLHRLIGRLVGVAYAGPLVWFAVRGRIPRGFGGRLIGILALGFGQGLLGWWMVASGLVDRPSVSHFRLAAHLGLALVIFSALWWTVMDFGGQRSEVRGQKGILTHGFAALALLATTIVWGAFTAGLKAGLVYNTFPLMNGHWVPAEPVNILMERGWVQFTHRWLAVTTGAVVFSFGWRRRDLALMAMVAVQISLGISTLLSSLWLPLAAAHQAGAIMLLALLLRALHRTSSRQSSSSPHVPSAMPPPRRSCH